MVTTPYVQTTSIVVATNHIIRVVADFFVCRPPASRSARLRIMFLGILRLRLSAMAHISHCAHHEVHPQRTSEQRQRAQDRPTGSRRGATAPEQRDREK